MKPIVKFTGKAEVYLDFFGNTVATITGAKDHPRLGSPPILYTSEVIDTDADSSGYFYIETLNTIYKKDQDEPTTSYRRRDESLSHDHLASSNS